MVTALYAHEDFARHVTPPGHPENPSRMTAVRSALSGPDFDALMRIEAPVGAVEDVLRCHPEGYYEAIRDAVPEHGFAHLDPDTALSPTSWNSQMRAVGGCCAAVDLVLSGGAKNAFVAGRPPGHHAEPQRPMGFGWFNSVAIAAKRALDHHGLSRVAVLDFDVHHGNGTQAILWEEERAFFASSHQMPLFPGSGASSERGAFNTIVNTPLPPGSGGAEMRLAWGQSILPAAERFAPELILVSAGFDAAKADPLASLNWLTEDFVWLTREICALADRVCGGRVVSNLEGGYDLDALAAAVAGHVTVLMEQDG